jgi:hypothetical protein
VKKSSENEISVQSTNISQNEILSNVLEGGGVEGEGEVARRG